jgi:hypothetical protein
MSSLSVRTLTNGMRVRAGIRWYFGALVGVITIYYLVLLSNGTLQIFAPETMGRVFDSMLMHLLRGEFTVDREAIGFEASTRNGMTYTYFGVFPALLRLAAVPFVDIAQVQLARLSCLTAVVIFVALQLRTLVIVDDRLPAGSRMPGFLAVMVAATVLSGPQLYILGSAWVYHEPVLWAAVLGAAFNLVVIRAALGRGPSTRDLVWLAVLAGLALNTRVSVGVSLYLGTVLVIGWSAWSRHLAERLERRPPGNGRWLRAAMSAMARDPSMWLPILVLGLLAGAAGIVNFERWGNPFTFADARYYDFFERHPNGPLVLHNYGVFNLGRIWIGALYYATGIPYLLKTVPPFAQFLHARYFGLEAPPLSPLLTNPLTALLAGIGLYRLWWKPDLAGGRLAILRLALIGHASAVVLILTFFYLTMRYRLDLAPFMTLAALVGYRSLCLTAAAASDTWRRRLGVAAAGLCVLGILGSHYILLVHKVWSAGVPMEVRLALLPFAPFAHAAFEP